MGAIVIGVQRVVGNVISCPLDLVFLHFLFIPFEEVPQYLLIQVAENHLELGFLKVLLELQLACEMGHLCLDKRINMLKEKSPNDGGEDLARKRLTFLHLLCLVFL